MDTVCLSKPYPFIFFKGCLPQFLLGLFLNTLSHIQLEQAIGYSQAEKRNTFFFVLFLDCSSVAGSYNNEKIHITFNNNRLKGYFQNTSKPNFFGNITASCQGTMTFLDEGTKRFAFNKRLNKLIWNGEDRQSTWIKGALLHFIKPVTPILDTICFQRWKRMSVLFMNFSLQILLK